jgi:inhibitor of cysteine peptidase
LLVAALLVACGDDQGSTVELDQGDSQVEVPLEVGDQLDVRLESNPTTGYSWQLGPLPEGLELVSSEFEGPDSDAAGAGGVEVFVFEATASGGGVLRLDYVRTFEDPIVPVESVEYDLVISE